MRLPRWIRHRPRVSEPQLSMPEMAEMQQQLNQTRMARDNILSFYVEHIRDHQVRARAKYDLLPWWKRLFTKAPPRPLHTGGYSALPYE